MSPYQMDPLMKLLFENGAWQAGNAANQLGGTSLAVLGSLLNRGMSPGSVPLGGSQPGIGQANPSLPTPFQRDPRAPWAGPSGYDSGWLERSLAERQAMYGKPTPIAPRQPLEQTNPILMGQSTADITDIPVGNRMTSARRWSGMDGRPGGGLEADPLGATRMSQPVVGGAIGPDANDISRQAAAAKHQAEIDALDAISGKAAPLWADLPSSKEEAFKALMAKGDPTSLYMAGNLNEDPLGRYGNPNAPVKFGEPGQRQYSDERLADLNTRRKAVEDRARRKGEAREMRMGGGDLLAMDKQMQMLQALGGGGTGGPAAAGPSGGYPSPEALMMLYGPQVGANVAEQYRLRNKDANDFSTNQAQIAIQKQQQDYMQQKLEEEQKQAAISSLPPTMRKPGYIDQVTSPGGVVPDERIALFVRDAMQQGMKYRDQISAHLADQGYTDQAQNDRVISSVFGGKEAFPAGGMFGWDEHGLIPSLFSGGGSSAQQSVRSKRGVVPMSMGQ